jgi:hypothetical protein
MTVATGSKAQNVLPRLNTEIVVSNLARGMDVCRGVFCIYLVLYR